MAHPQELALTQLVPCKLNPRKVFIASEIDEIAESAAQLVGDPPRPRGILEPLIVRATRGHTAGSIWEIIAGAKRFKAAAKAKLATVPVRVIEATDREVLEDMLIENLMRSDPHPLEEAEGFRKLLEMDKTYTADVIAEKVGKDRSYVYKRLQLTELIEPLKGKFLQAKINISHALQLCRLRDDDQVYVAKEGLFHGYGSDREATSPERLRDFIERNVLLKLAGVPWSLSDPELVPAAGACITCTKRTGANLALFDDAPKDDRCLDRKCFETKRAALVQLSIAKAGENGVDLVKVAKGWQQRQKKQPAGVLVDGQYNEAIKSKCAKPESAIVVAGEDVGRKFQLCRGRSCKHHGGYHSKPRTATDIWKEKELQLSRQIDELVDHQVARTIIGKVDKLGEHETRAAARELLDSLGDDDLKFLAEACGLDVSEAAKKKRDWRSNPLADAINAQIAVSGSKLVAKLIVGALALQSGVRNDRRADFEHAYRIDRKKIGAAVGAQARAAFKAEKRLALAKAKKPKKPAPPIKAKAAKGGK